MKKLLTFGVWSGVVLSAVGSAASGAAPPVPAAPLHFLTTPQNILDGAVRIQAGPELQYLDAEGARRVIVELWGNPPETADGVLGLLLAGTQDLKTPDSWAVVITENHDGHVSDDDASSIDYAQLLRDMKRGTEESNADRVKAGYPALTLLDWAEPPSYDAAAHKLVWAKQLAHLDNPGSTTSLNYAVRVLGRDSTLELNAVGDPAQLAAIRTGMTGVLQKVSFTQGHAYSDYTEGSDKLATYGVAGLVAGGLAAKKLGLLAVALGFGKKFFVLLLVALAGLRRLFRRRPGPEKSGPETTGPANPATAPGPVSLTKPGERP